MISALTGIVVGTWTSQKIFANFVKEERIVQIALLNNLVLPTDTCHLIFRDDVMLIFVMNAKNATMVTFLSRVLI